tara:strand:+ start:452 stop:907 length:456 start_codon:yes stop_codon:yes gene_type:complete
MNTYFKVIEDIKTALSAEPFINKVSQGDIYEVDLSKKTLFPLAHLIIESIDIQTNRIQLSLSLLLMDIVDLSKESSNDLIRGNDNELDAINNMVNVAARLQAVLAKTDTYNANYELEGSFSCTPFKERFENNLAGVSADFTINLSNDMTKC